jgi:hypothetical protein
MAEVLPENIWSGSTTEIALDRVGQGASRVQDLHYWRSSEVVMGSLVMLLGFTTLGCGCVVGRYREVATRRELAYVEEKGGTCQTHSHRRNHTLPSEVRGRQALEVIDAVKVG